jgi:hypothetical protein
MITNPWVIVGLIVLWLASMAGVAIKATDIADTAWEAKIEKQKVEAAKTLLDETNKVRDLEKRLQDKANEVEKNHVAATQEIAAASARYNRLGKLYESVKGCRGGSGSANGSTASAPSVDHGGEGSRENISGPADDSIERIAQDADLLRVTVQACQQYLRELPLLLR